MWFAAEVVWAQAPIPTARLSGIVVTTDEAPQPVRRAIVSMWGGVDQLGHHAVTTDEGRFEIAKLPPGRYTLSAARASYVTIEHGATKAGWPGTPLALGSGQHLSGVRLLLARGAVVTGTIRDAQGAPIPDVEVRVERRSLPVVIASATRVVRTDEQGIYRVFGLAAGAYVVSVRPDRTGTDLTLAPRDAEVDDLLTRLRNRALIPSASTTPGTRAVLDVSRRVSDFLPVYYPSATSAEDALPVTLRVGEERAGIDVTVQLMPSSIVSGLVIARDARPPTGVEVILSRASAQRVVPPVSTNVQDDGTFRFANVTPGMYRIVARAIPGGRWSAPSGTRPAGQGGSEESRSCLTASADLSVHGTAVSGITLSLQPCLRIEGRINFRAEDGSGPPHRGGVQIILDPDRFSDPLGFVPRRLPAISAPNGQFSLGEFGDVVPGRFLVRVEQTGAASDRAWTLQSIVVEGQDVSNQPLEITQAMSGTIKMDVVFTNQRTSLSGRLVTADGRPATEFTLVVFTTNRAWWQPPFRRVLATRPATDGEYQFEDLPPGEYYLTALTEVAPGEWRDSAFLEEIVRVAIRLTVAPGEAKIQGLRIGGTPDVE